MMIIFVVILGIHIFLYSFFRKPSIPTLQDPYDFILVLGCPTHEDGTLSSFQVRRIEAACYYYKQGYAKTIICSGGSVKNTYSEAEVIAKKIQKECPNADIRLETKSRNTFQNLRNVKAMMKGNHILVVSGSSHLRRAYFFVKKYYPEASMGSGLQKDPWYAYIWEYTRMWVALYWEVKLYLKEKVSFKK